MKKKIFTLLGTLVVFTVSSYADEPATACPDGYYSYNEPLIVITETTCPDGYSSITGKVSTCLESYPNNTCYMYILAGSAYTNQMGTYEYTELCPLE